MGDPKSSRRKFQKPSHPWQGERIKREDEFVRKYGLKNKKEFWKAESLLRAQRAQARHYLPRVLREDQQAKRESDALLAKLNRLGVLDRDAGLDDVLALNVEAILSRRLQTVAFMKGLANTPKQARQFIAHGHIAVGDRRVNVPGYLVTRQEEQAVDFAVSSPLQNEAHPLRQQVAGESGAGITAAEAAEMEAEVVEEPDADTAEEDEADEEPEEAEEEAEATEEEEEEPTSDEAEEPEEAEEAEAPEEEAEAEAPEEPTEATADDEPEGEEEADTPEEAAEPSEAAEEKGGEDS